MRTVWPLVAACLAVFGGGGARLAAAEDLPVDVELVLAVDVSWSMNDEEQRIQREGYVAAWRSPDVLEAIRNGVYGRVAVTYVEWAGELMQNVVVPWTLIDGKEAADRFAYQLATAEPDRQRRTSISTAIDYSAGLFPENGYAGNRQVIDVSGDGANNQGRPVTMARDAAVAAGIIINGLPLMTSEGSENAYAWGSVPDLDLYYAECVIGGPGAFVIPVRAWDQFPEAIRRKLVLELAWPLRPPSRSEEAPVLRAAAGGGDRCLSGERMWRMPQGTEGLN